MASDLKPCPYCAHEWQRNVQDMAEGFAAGQRGPVVPIPVSEPPGDDDIVLAADLRIDRPDEEEWLSWEYENAPCTGEFFKKHYAPKEWVTHYLLLRKGE